MRSPFKFFILVFFLATPIWLLSIILGNIAALKVPFTDLALAFMPMVAAIILVYKEGGFASVKSLLKKVFDYKRIKKKIWYLPLIFLMPLLYLLIFGVMHLMGDNQFADYDLSMLPIFFVLFFILAAGEEVGWMGYAIDPLQERWGALKGSIILSIPWWVGHFPSIIHIGGTIKDLAWWLPGAISSRILIVWLYNNTNKSLFVPVFFHSMINFGRIISYPGKGSHYNSDYQAVGYIVITATATIIVLMWDSKTLTKDSKLRKSMRNFLTRI